MLICQAKKASKLLQFSFNAFLNCKAPRKIYLCLICRTLVQIYLRQLLITVDMIQISSKNGSTGISRLKIPPIIMITR